jgi:hypothetical protein
MGTVKSPPPVLFFSSIIFNDSGILSEVLERLPAFVGPIEEKTATGPFLDSAYYAPEMGPGLLRCFVLFRSLRQREELAGIKRGTNAIEQAFAVEGRRSVNLDPGYIALEHVVLATTKGYAHRIYLGEGIFADLTLVYRNGTYRGLAWTYPDYGGEELRSMLNGWRERYKRTLQWQKA